MSKPEVIYLVGTWANLLSNTQINLCQAWDDDSCLHGVIKIDAFRRGYVAKTLQETQGQANVRSLVISRLDTKSAFVQMHPQQWAINKVVLHDMLRYKLFVHPPSLLYQNKVDYPISLRDLTPLQSTDFPFLLSNVQVPPTSSWYPYVRSVYWDEDTRCAVMVAVDTGDPANVDPVGAIKACLTYVARVNEGNGCQEGAATPPTGTCWIPVVLMTDSPLNNPMIPFVDALANFEHPPSLILGVEGDADTDPKYPVPTKVGEKTWAFSYWMDEYHYYHTQLTTSSGSATTASQVEFANHPLAGLPEYAMDETYKQQIAQIRLLANEALLKDRVVGYTDKMPDPRVGDNFRACQAGPCEVATLFVDALRWQTKADVAFMTSGGVREGWNAGPVLVRNLWTGLPFPNTLCTGTLSGISLFRILEYSTRIAAFDVRDSDLADDLLQLSGIRVTYDSKLERGKSKLIDIEIYNQTTSTYQPLDRLRLYSFASDSFVCGSTTTMYSTMLGPQALILPGEVPALIRDTTHHRIVEEFLTANHNTLATAYTPHLENRLLPTNQTGLKVLNLIETSDSCLTDGTQHWVEPLQSCQDCPDTSMVAWLREEMEFLGVSGSSSPEAANITLMNAAAVDVSVTPKSFPSWFSILSINALEVSNERNPYPGSSTSKESITLSPGHRLRLEYAVSAKTLEPGTALGSVSFGVVATATDYAGCQAGGHDASFQVLMRAQPPEDQNYLGGVRWMGWVLALVVFVVSIACATWVIRNRQNRAVKTMQPTFLVTICVGIAIMGLTLIPLGFDDEILSEHGCNIACMAVPWFLSTGFCVTFAALFSKLWRINKLLGAKSFRRVQVKEKDVLVPFLLTFSLNLILLVLLTVLDPLEWVREAIDGQAWNTYGMCRTDIVGNAFLLSLAAVNFVALVAACWQAYKARNLSDEFSESKSIGLALYGWIQLVLVGVPIMMMLSKDSVAARYFLYTAMVFAICITMLGLIFYPVVMNVISPTKGRSTVHVSGLVAPGTDSWPSSPATKGGGKAYQCQEEELKAKSSPGFKKSITKPTVVRSASTESSSSEAEVFREEECHVSKPYRVWSNTESSGLDLEGARPTTLERIEEGTQGSGSVEEENMGAFEEGHTSEAKAYDTNLVDVEAEAREYESPFHGTVYSVGGTGEANAIEEAFAEI